MATLGETMLTKNVTKSELCGMGLIKNDKSTVGNSYSFTKNDVIDSCSVTATTTLQLTTSGLSVQIEYSAQVIDSITWADSNSQKFPLIYFGFTIPEESGFFITNSISKEIEEVSYDLFLNGGPWGEYYCPGFIHFDSKRTIEIYVDKQSDGFGDIISEFDVDNDDLLGSSIHFTFETIIPGNRMTPLFLTSGSTTIKNINTNISTVSANTKTLTTKTSNMDSGFILRSRSKTYTFTNGSYRLYLHCKYYQIGALHAMTYILTNTSTTISDDTMITSIPIQSGTYTYYVQGANDDIDYIITQKFGDFNIGYNDDNSTITPTVTYRANLYNNNSYYFYNYTLQLSISSSGDYHTNRGYAYLDGFFHTLS